MKAGLLLPFYHKAYWMGGILRPDDNYPNYRWVDSSPGIPGSSYLHWGVPKGGTPEPNGNAGDQPCIIARATLSFQNRWGWADEVCEELAAAICEIAREWHLLLMCKPAWCWLAYCWGHSAGGIPGQSTCCHCWAVLHRSTLCWARARQCWACIVCQQHDDDTVTGKPHDTVTGRPHGWPLCSMCTLPWQLPSACGTRLG